MVGDEGSMNYVDLASQVEHKARVGLAPGPG